MERFAKLGWHYDAKAKLVISPTGETMIHAESEPTDAQLSIHMLKLKLAGRAMYQCVETETMLSECAVMARAFPPAMFAGQ